MSNPAHKKSIRRGHRSSATKMVHKAQELLSQESMNYAQLAKTRLSLQEKISVLKTLDAEIVDLVKEEEVGEEIERADQYMEDLYDVLARMEEVLHSSSSRPLATGPTPATTDDRHPPTKVKLPKLTIQPFKGELTAWVTFWDSYDAAIHSNSSLSGIERFNYLRTFLQGPALEAIAGLKLTADNYPEAIEVLKRLLRCSRGC